MRRLVSRAPPLRWTEKGKGALFPKRNPSFASRRGASAARRIRFFRRVSTDARSQRFCIRCERTTPSAERTARHGVRQARYLRAIFLSI